MKIKLKNHLTIFLLVILLILLNQITAFAFENKSIPLQDNPDFVWPIANSTYGVDMIHSPLDQVYDKQQKKYMYYLTYDLGGEEGAPILAVADGRIENISYNFSNKSYFCWRSDSYEEMLEIITKYDIEEKYISYFISLDLGNGEKVNYSGLSTKYEIPFKTGDIVKQGEIIGRLGYSFTFIDNPHLHVEYSVNGKLGDLQKKFTGIRHQVFIDKENA